MSDLLQRASLIGALTFGFALTAAWAVILGYGLFWLAELAFQRSL